MLKVMLVCVGKLKERYLADACAEYCKRLGAFCRLEVVQVEEERCPEKPSLAQIQAVLQAEGRRILSKTPPGAHLVSLSMSPMTFPHQLARVMLLEQLYRSFQIQSGGKYHK